MDLGLLGGDPALNCPSGEKRAFQGLEAELVPDPLVALAGRLGRGEAAFAHFVVLSHALRGAWKDVPKLPCGGAVPKILKGGGCGLQEPQVRHRLLGPKKWSYYYLYVIMDIYSRYVVGWMVADRENSALAGRLIQQSCLKHGVQPRVLTLHSDRGAPMTSQCTAQLLADLGVTRSLSRPQVSDDNPFSEALNRPGFIGDCLT